jgi:hypothetical protein
MYYDDEAATVGMGDLPGMLLPEFLGGDSGARYAVVTTNDAPPDGDLRIRTGPGTDYPPIGGAEKGGTVTVVGESSDGKWLEVSWAGGLRRPAANGWAYAAFLTPTDTPPSPLLPYAPPPATPPGVVIEPPEDPGNLNPASSTDGGTPKLLMVAAGVAVVGLGVYLLGSK